MATQQVTYLIDDLDKSQGDDIEGVEFGYKGVSYRIDLTADHVKEFDAAMAPYLDGARRVTRSPVRATSVGRRAITRSDRDQNQAIRAWAKSQGLVVSDRGRIPVEVLDAFERAH